MPQDHGDAFDHETAEGLLSALRQVSVRVPTWHLTESERWHLFRDTLLGHVRVRGSLRPRDLPLDPACQTMIDRAIQVLQKPVYAVRGGTIRFRHWLAYFLILTRASSRTGTRSEDDPHALLSACVLELCFALSESGMTDPDALANSPYVQRLIGVLGLSQQEWLSLVKAYKTSTRGPGREGSESPHPVFLARWAALVTAIDNAPQPGDYASRNLWCGAIADALRDFHAEAKPLKEKMLRALDDRFVRYATLKVEGPQSYIRRGKRHWLHRGASAWCSQTLALARDLLVTGQDGDEQDGLLFTDSDAIVSAWFPGGVDEVAHGQLLERNVNAFWRLDDGDNSALCHRYPRLARWLVENLPHGDGDRRWLERDSQLPYFAMWFSKPMSVLEVCAYRVEKKKKRGAPNEDPVDHGSCGYVMNDTAVAFGSSPPWLSSEDDTAKVDRGITSIVWTLCGTAFRTHAHDGLCESLGLSDASLQKVHHGQWLEQLGIRNSHLTHLKMDGDGVGETFRKSPLADFPWLGMELGRAVQRRLVAGLRAAFAAHTTVHPATESRTLPVDVVYLGGDDLYVVLPWEYTEIFLAGFGGLCTELRGSPWENTTFTFAAARLQPRDDLLRGVQERDQGEVLARANQAAMKVVTEELSAIKKNIKENAPIADARFAGLAENYDVTIHIDPFVFALGCVRGRLVNVRRC